MPYMIIMMWSQICWIFRRKYSFQRAFRPALLLYAEILRIIFRCLFNPGYCRKQLSLHRQPLQQQCFVLSFLSTSVTFIYYHHQRFLPSQRRRLRWYYGFIWLPATNLISTMPCKKNSACPQDLPRYSHVPSHHISCHGYWICFRTAIGLWLV